MMRRMKVNPVPWTLPGDLDCAAWRRLDATFCSNESRYPVSPHHFVTPTDRLEIILCHQSFFIRVSDLTTFIERCPPEALKDNFQLIVDSIFSNRNREQAWDLRSMRRADHPREASAVFKLLAPNGPLMTLALRLMDDHNFLLEFPLDGLPPYLMQKLQRMDIPPFFANKVSIMYDLHRQCNVIHHLSLNPFEYYMFSFASVNLLGINSGGVRSTDYLHGWAVLQDTLYTNLLEEYLVYFFPCDGSGVPSHNFNYAPAETVFLANSLLRQNYAKKSFYGVNYGNDLNLSMEDNLPKLFKSSILQDQASPNVNRENIYHATHPSAYKEVWRSETILHCFVELWMSAPEDCSVLIDGSKSNVSAGPLAYGGLPSVEVVKSVRMLVRHLHYFMNCVNSHANHPMEDIKRNSFPMFQIKLYKFLRFIFQYWPLDNSFRIVYETWLSYIQPWRYLRFERRRTVQSAKESEVPIDRRWFPFLLDNILYYSILFSKVLDRLERVDLSATKNALMFYRVAKVLTCQESLKSMLLEIESYIQTYLQLSPILTQPVATPPPAMHSSRNINFSTPMSSRSSALNNVLHGTSRLSPVRACPPSPSFTSAHGLQDSAMATSAVKVAHLKQMLKDFESPSYVYEQIFSKENIKKVCGLIRAAVEARDILAVSAAKFNEGSHKSQTWLQWLKGNPSPSQMAIQNANEKTKAANQLEFARNQFSLFFDLNGEFLAELPRPSQPFSRMSELSDASMELNGRSICVDRVSRKSILPPDILVEDSLIPIGNPDLALIRSDEIGFLVRLLYALSKKLNAVFADTIPRVYFSKGWAGRFSRALLAEPQEYLVRGPGRGKYQRYKRYLPPRFNLRFLASYYTAFYVFAAFVLANMLGLTPMQWVFVPLIFYSGYLLFRAASEPINMWCDLYEKYVHNERLSEVEDLGLGGRGDDSNSKDK